MFEPIIESKFLETNSGINIGFWNLKQNELSDYLVMLTKENSIDILCLAEVSIEKNTIELFLNKINTISTNILYRQINFSKNDKVYILSRFNLDIFTDKSNLYPSNMFVSQFIQLETKISFNLIVIHFHSKMHWSDMSQAMECVTVSQAIQKIEQNTNNKNTIIIGDFNMNPFETGMVAANGFNALSYLQIYNKSKMRFIDKTRYPFFYNPMWNFLGDFEEPNGTYFYRQSGNVSYDWHLFDQILLRPNMKNYLAGTNFVKIITTIGGDSLLKSQGRPNYSDHLPITLKLTL